MKKLPCVNRHLLWFTLCVLLVTGSPSFAYDISGTYVEKYTNAAILIEIVQTKDGQLTGRFEEVFLKPDGEFDNLNATIAGATNGQTIAVTMKPNEFLAGSLVSPVTLKDGSSISLAADTDKIWTLIC